MFWIEPQRRSSDKFWKSEMKEKLIQKIVLDILNYWVQMGFNSKWVHIFSFTLSFDSHIHLKIKSLDCDSFT